MKAATTATLARRMVDRRITAYPWVSESRPDYRTSDCD
jgi:hypothetical protein